MNTGDKPVYSKQFTDYGCLKINGKTTYALEGSVL
jgi:glycerol kinase